MLTVMIIDDAPLLRERLRSRVAEIPGVDIVGEAGDVPQALEEFRRLVPHVVILDVQMPGGTGIDVLGQIKRERPATHVIMLTNYPLPQLRKKCEQAGAEYFFDKCGEFEMVPTVIHTLVRQQLLPERRPDRRNY